MAGIPVSPVDRLMRKAGAQRVSEDASKKMVEVLEEYASDVARAAADVARHTGRKTVKAEDIKLALKK
ncbi:MAG: histone family protein [Archaeoglobaceae archaeon]